MQILSKSHLVIFLVAFLLIVGLLLRIQIFHLASSYYNYKSTVSDDNDWAYLIAHHIVAYSEVPYTGIPSTWERYTNSPVYFYLLAVPLLVWDNFIFLGFFNVILQLATVFLVFVLAMVLFGTGTAFIAAILFGFNQKILYQSAFVWQPHIMQPFVTLSYLLLAFGFFKKKFVYMLLSIIFFFFSLALYSSVFALAPLYLLFLFFGIKNFGGTIRHYAIAAVTCIGSYTFFYAPLFFYLKGRTPSVVKSFLGQIDLSSAKNFLPFAGTLFSRFFLNDTNIAALSIFVIFAVAILTLYYFLCSEHNIRQKKIMFAMAFCAAWLLFAASLLPVRGMPMLRYLTPILPLVSIFFAEIINSSSGWVLKAVLVISMLYLATPNLFFSTQNAVRQFMTDGQSFFVVPYRPPPFLAAVKGEILKTKTLEGKTNYEFFGFRVYGRDDYTNNSQYTLRKLAGGVFWNSLEIEMQEKLTKVDDAAPTGYRPLSDEQYIFLTCLDEGQTGQVAHIEEDDTNSCFVAFLKDFPEYKLQKIFWAEPYQMYLTKR